MSLGSLIWNDTVRYLRHFHDRLIDGNPEATTYLYHSWISLDDKDDPARWIAYEREAYWAWQCVATRINQSLAAEGRTDRVLPLPAAASLQSSRKGTPSAKLSVSARSFSSWRSSPASHRQARVRSGAGRDGRAGIAGDEAVDGGHVPKPLRRRHRDDQQHEPDGEEPQQVEPPARPDPDPGRDARRRRQ